MKLVIGGASGFVGSELLRQALNSKAVTSIIAIGRRNVSAPEGMDGSKLSNIVLADLNHYSDEDKKNLSDVDGCIWTIAITPSKSKSVPWEDVKKVNQEYPMTCLKTLIEARRGAASASRPLRFIYFSGALAERDQTRTPRFMTQHMLMRGEGENMVLKYAAESENAVEVCVLKPGFIMGPRIVGRNILSALVNAVYLPSVKVEECAAASIKQCLEGIEKEPLMNEDIRSIGAAYLLAQQ